MKICVSPNERGQGYGFTDDTQGGVVPKDYIQSIDQAIQEAMRSGVLAGYEMVDLKVSLYDGSFHELDSNKMAFRIAGSMAFKEAARKAKPVLLQPVMRVEVLLPKEDAARVVDDLHERRGRVERVEAAGAAQAIHAAVPLSTMLGYAAALRGLCQGRARLLMEFKQWEIRASGWDSADDQPCAMPATPKRPGGSHLRAMQQADDTDS